MGNKLKLSIIGLLGFTTACSTVKKSEKSAEAELDSIPATEYPSIRVMYGVPFPDGRTAIPLSEVKEAEKAAEQKAEIENSDKTDDGNE